LLTNIHLLLYTGCTGCSWHHWFCHCWMSALQGSSLENDRKSRQEKAGITSDSFSH